MLKRLSFGALALVASLSLGQAPPPPGKGVLVETVAGGAAGAKAGLKPGDTVLSWEIVPAGSAAPARTAGSVNSTFDLIEVEYEYAPRGTITLRGVRDGSPMAWTFPPGRWRTRVRPALSDSLLKASGDPTHAVWLRWQVARGLSDQDAEQSRAALREAILRARESNLTLAAAILSRELGLAHMSASQWGPATEAFGTGEQLWNSVHAAGAGVAQLVNDQGVVADWQGDLGKAESHHLRALEIRKRVVPGSVDEGMSLSNLGSVAYSRGLPDAAARYFRASLAIAEVLQPGTLEHASSLQNVGAALSEQGAVAEAYTYLVRALDITKAVAPDGPEMADRYASVGVMDRNRGDLATAEERLRQAAAITARLQPRHPSTAHVQVNLGAVLQLRGDYAAAEDTYQQARALLEAVAPSTAEYADVLSNLGSIDAARGDLVSAERWVIRALKVYEGVEKPASIGVAQTLQNLARLAADQRQWARAEPLARRALTILDAKAPNRQDRYNSLEILGDIHAGARRWRDAIAEYARALQSRAALGDETSPSASLLAKQARAYAQLRSFDQAQKLHAQAIAILEKTGPSSFRHAQALHAFGETRRQQGRLAEASELFLKAVDIIDQLQGKVGGSDEQRGGFSARYARFYDDAIDVLARTGKPLDAFRTLERARARSFLALLAERDLTFEADIPKELARERRFVDAEYEATLRRLDSAASSKESRDQLNAKLGPLRERRREIARLIRQASPSLAGLQYPRTLDAAGVREAVDPGTVVLSYWIGNERSLLFVLSAPAAGAVANGVEVFEIRAGAARLRELVGRFRTEVHGPRSSAATSRSVGGLVGPAVASSIVASQLYQLLIKPAEKLIAPADRILLLPDGPLHEVPFAALKPAGSLAGRARYLVEWKPLHVAVSGTVYQELRQRRQSAGVAPPVRLVAFGDPAYTLKEPVLPRLPGTRREVNALAALFPGQAVVHVGNDATEERARAIAGPATYVHFAAHAVLDDRFPLEAAVALTPGAAAADRHDGFLRAWEVFEHVRLDASLVTLSACESALGKEFRGEGLLGLTRAFHHAGARSVLSSLWSIADDSTADLMASFYRQLAAGVPKDVALRAAQLESIRRGGAAAQPFHWAAFQLSGDWR